MKKVIIAIIALFLVFVLGFMSGARNVLFNSPKWVEEVHGQYLIVTDFFGHEYVDMADKTGNMYNYFSYVVERRPLK